MADPVIGLYGGTFDPPHFGHLTLAIALKERHALEQVWFIPAHRSPFAKHKNSSSAADRLKMVELAIEDIAGFSALDIELRRPPPSYTIDTIAQLQQQFPQTAFALLMSNDIAETFYTWKDAELIRNKVKIFIGNRKRGQDRAEQTPIVEISSTEIRERVKKGLYCGHLLPAKVLDYIYNNGLYSLP